jgi:3'(2'),5'-bisphosphate nucleotidase
MNSTDSKPLLETAIHLALKAAEQIRTLVPTREIHSRKSDDSVVTKADLASEEIILKGLRSAFPDHGILSEEAGILGNTQSDYLWMVDPLDGSKAFAKGIPGFCVMIGLLQQGKPFLGVIADPLEGHLYQAVRGEGALHTLNGKTEKLSVSERKKFEEMPIAISSGFPEKQLGEIRSRLSSPFLPPINSVGIKVGLLVRKIGDIYLNHHAVSFWDTCAPLLILEEAGGRMTAWNGDPLSYPLRAPYSHLTPTLASNGARHQDLIDLIASISL